MSRPNRPSAMEAIEVLKIHQLRKENKAIFDEIQQLRKEVTDRKDELNNALKRVTDLSTELKNAIQTTAEQGTTLGVLQKHSDSVDGNLENLRQDQEALRNDLDKQDEINQAIERQRRSDFQKLREAVGALEERAVNADAKRADRDDDLVGSKENHNEKADVWQQVILDLKDKFARLSQDVVDRLTERESASKVTNTPSELLATQAMTKDVQIDDNRIDSCWEPIKPIKEIRVAGAQNAADGRVASIRIHDQHRSQLADEAVPSPPKSATMNIISNISHRAPITEPSDAVVEVPLPRGAQILPCVSQPAQVHAVHTAVQEADNKISESDGRSRISHEMGTAEGLQNLLQLRQQQNESLEQYLDRFLTVFATFPPDNDVDAACSRRFFSQMLNTIEKAFVQQWLATSEHNVSNVRDSVILLSRCRTDAGDRLDLCLGNDAEEIVDAATHQKVDIERVRPTETDTIDNIQHRESFQPVDGMLNNSDAARPAKSRGEGQSAITKHGDAPNVTTRAAAQKKWKADVHRKGMKSNQARKRLVDASYSVTPTEGRLRRAFKHQATGNGGDAVNRGPAGITSPELPMMPVTPLRVDEQHTFPDMSASQMPKTPCAPRTVQRGVSDVADTLPSSPPIHSLNSVSRADHTEFRKVQDPFVGNQDSPCRQTHGLRNIVHGRINKRIPALVQSQAQAPTVQVPDTSDQGHFPPVNHGGRAKKRFSQGKKPAKKKRARHNTPSPIPVPSHSNVDFVRA